MTLIITCVLLIALLNGKTAILSLIAALSLYALGTTFGRQRLGTTVGAAVKVTADGNIERQENITLDWSLFAAAGSDTTWPDGNVLLTGQKGFRFGQVLTRVRKSEVQTVDLSGDDD